MEKQEHNGVDKIGRPKKTEFEKLQRVVTFRTTNKQYIELIEESLDREISIATVIREKLQ